MKNSHKSWKHDPHVGCNPQVENYWYSISDTFLRVKRINKAF